YATHRAATDKYAHHLYTTDDLTIVDALNAVATRRALPPAQIALAWLLSKPAVTVPIVGATRPEHVDDAVMALDFALDANEVASLEIGYRPHSIRGHD
ncbi:MAG TPA: aldo/keto reductase, partial [Mycobacterium sp.]|nr:aldo/keto reductase [Mycobacterium sp.]